MGVFGDRLRREREMRGVTLDEIAESTKISRRSLEALEEENFDLLPGGIFNKGFVRAYARYLGIDEEQAVADYVAARQEPIPAEDQFPLEIHEDKDERRPPLNEKKSFLPLILAIIALVVGVVGWTYWTKHKSQFSHVNADQEKPAAPVSSTPAPVTVASSTPQAPATLAASPTVSPSSTSVAPDPQKTAGSTDTSSSSSDKQAASSGTSSTDKTDKSATRPEQKNAAQVLPEMKAESGKSFKVSIKAHEDSWYSVQKDGEPAIEGILKADKHKDFKAKQALVLKIGNAGGVEVSHNGKALGPLGEQGVARTLTFKSNGLEQ